MYCVVPGKVSFEGPSASILNTDHVSVVCPDILEQVLKQGLVLHLHVVLQDPQPDQHCLQIDPGEHALHHIGPVQAVNAVSPEHSTLKSKQII